MRAPSEEKTIEAVKGLMLSRGVGIDTFHDDDWQNIKNVTNDPRPFEEVKRVTLNLRRNGKIGPVLGGAGPKKVENICPHCGGDLQ